MELSDEYESGNDDDFLQKGEHSHFIPTNGAMHMGWETEPTLSVKKRPRKPWLPSWYPTRFLPTRFFCWLCLLFVVIVILLGLANVVWDMMNVAPPDGQSPPWYPTPRGGTAKDWQDSYRKAAEMVRKMTVVEKVNITTGVGWMMGLCVGNTGPVPRLGFPSLCLQDGPLGIRFADNITAFPAGITVGATWNQDLMFQRGKAHGLEARLKGVNVLLGPAMGPIGRSPLGGRNWEGFGSDPVLQGIAAAETIKGIQSEGVMATAKHWVGNEQEHFRQSWEWLTPNAISSNIDDRTLHELYSWPFMDSVRAGVASVMCSYNQLNNSYACQNSKLMNGVLKDEFGFQGFVQSDWLAQRSGVSSALAGLDMDMPGDGLRWADGKSLWGASLTTSVLNGSLPLERINDMATRIVAAWYQLGQDDRKKWGDGPNFSSWTENRIGLVHAGSDDKSTDVVNKFINVQGEGKDSHGRLARKIAVEGTVLLKNVDDFLPMNRSGWPHGRPKKKDAKYYVGVIGSDAHSDPKGPNSCVDRACSSYTLGSGYGSGAVEFPYLISPYEALKDAFNDSSIEVTSFPTNSLSRSQKKAIIKQDLCLVFIMADAGEGYKSVGSVKGDRNDLLAQNGGEQLVQDVSRNCGGDVVVIIHAVGPVLLESFVDEPKVRAILFANLPGQESGNAITDVLFGEADPSGRLPFTIGKKLEDYGPSAKIITKFSPKAPVPQLNFTEGLLVDYRHFDHFGIRPRFEFGFGLSYTSFSLSDIKLQVHKAKSALPDPRPPPEIPPPEFDSTIPDPKTALFPPGFRKLKKYIYPYIGNTKNIQIQPSQPHDPSPLSPAGGAPGGNPSLYNKIATVRATVKNSGTRSGSCVVQLYISFPKNYVDPETNELVFFPTRVLRNFQKIELDRPNKSALVKMDLTRRDLSYWSVSRGNWVMPTAGLFTVEVGFSSRDLPLRVYF
jgi:beta-glucosidase